MSSPAKPPAKKATSSGGWGFGSIINNLESRLDTILAEDGEASARERAADTSRRDASRLQRTNSGRLAPPAKNAVGGDRSREASRTRGNDRLAERLAKATAAKTGSQAGSAVPSRVGTPAIEEDGRASGEVKRSAEIARSVPDITKTEDAGEKEDTSTEEGSTLLNSGLPLNPARLSRESSRPSIEVTTDEASARPSTELSNGHITKTNAELEADMDKMREAHTLAEKQRQEEMHTYLEKIDALQAKLQYLARETVAAAKEANASTDGEGKKLAEKDAQIAQLMEEGENLSKKELKHLQTIKKLRAGRSEDDKAATELKRRLERVEKSENELQGKLRRAEAVQRQANEKTKQITNIEKQVEELRIDRESAAERIRSLTTQLKEAKQKTERAEKEVSNKAAEVDKGKIAALENELEDAKIEKKLAEDRALSESRKLKEEAEAEKQRSSVREMEMKTEIASLESRLEAMRTRVEEGFSTAESGESGVKLMRQVETLQSQYSLAKDNWETIESSLTSRLVALETERDEAVKREGEVRKKAREAGLRGRRAEEELEGERERVGVQEEELRVLREEVNMAREKIEGLEQSLADTKAESERQRRLWETETQQKLEEEKAKWQRQPGKAGRTESPSAFASSRKLSSAELHPTRKTAGANRLTSHDLSALQTQHQRLDTGVRPTSRRSSNIPAQCLHSPQTPRAGAPSPSRNNSFTQMPPQTPSLSIADVDDDFEPPATPPSQEGSHSANRTINDLLSTSAAPTASATGPSIQLVERLSTTIRRLESEKATFRDELARLSQQRDAAREEVVSFMREKENEGEAEGVKELRGRYESCLEMLGEREEECVELRADVGELKRLYNELVGEKMGGK